MLPVNEIKNGYTPEDINKLRLMFDEMMNMDPDTPGFLTHHPVGIVFDVDAFMDRYPILSTIYERFPFLERRASFIITRPDGVKKLKPHSDDSHGSVFTVLEGDNTTETTWYRIKSAPAHNKSGDLYGVVPYDDTKLEIRHKQILETGKTYLFDSHTFHSVKNESDTRRIVFTVWLDHIAYHPAYEYYKENGLI